MAYADYAHCEGCDTKVFYLGDLELGEDIQVWHTRCLEAEVTRRLDAAPSTATGY